MLWTIDDELTPDAEAYLGCLWGLLLPGLLGFGLTAWSLQAVRPCSLRAVRPCPMSMLKAS